MCQIVVASRSPKRKLWSIFQVADGQEQAIGMDGLPLLFCQRHPSHNHTRVSHSRRSRKRRFCVVDVFLPRLGVQRL